jgi:hypothetical protein
LDSALFEMKNRFRRDFSGGKPENKINLALSNKVAHQFREDRPQSRTGSRVVAKASCCESRPSAPKQLAAIGIGRYWDWVRLKVDWLPTFHFSCSARKNEK